MIFYKKGAENSVPFFLCSIYEKKNMCMNWLDGISLNKSSFGFLNDTEGYAKIIKDKEKNDLEDHIIKENEEIVITKPTLRYEDIIQVDFPEHLYFKEKTNKKQIVLHHTVSGRGVTGDINWWKQNPQRIATCVIVDWKGDIYQLFSSTYWAHHLGIKAANNTALNKAAIGIEIDAWGALMKENKDWYPALWDTNQKKYVPNKRVKPIENIQKYPKSYRGFYGYEKYTNEQIESVRKLLIYWSEQYNIPLTYNPDMWELNQRALRGDAGVWSHTSYRQDKSDAHPQDELIDMLKSLK